MQFNLKEIHTNIMSAYYSNHPGKSADAYYFEKLELENYDFIKSIILKHGFAIINCQEKPLLFISRMLKKTFGKPIRDVGIRKNYIAKVAPMKGGKFYVNSAFAQPLHTDEGYRREFPRFVSLYCVKPSQIGGVSTIIKVESILAEMYKLFDKDVNNFFQSSFVQIHSTYDEIHKQILFKLDEKIVGMSYSPILKKIESTDLGSRMLTFINQFIHDPSNQYRIKLNKNDLLIMDNCRVLHGRTALGENDDRLILRLWNKLVKL